MYTFTNYTNTILYKVCVTHAFRRLGLQNHGENIYFITKTAFFDSPVDHVTFLRTNEKIHAYIYIYILCNKFNKTVRNPGTNDHY